MYQNSSLSQLGFLSENDPFEANAFEVLRAKWIDDSKKLYGDFIQSHGSKSLRKVNRKHLPEAVAYIKRRLLADWSEINFIIGSNPDDYIELRFQLEDQSSDARVGLKAYMNVLCDQDAELTKFHLRKVGEFWGISDKPSGTTSSQSNVSVTRKGGELQVDESGGYVYYMLAPPWAHKRDPILYLMQL